jgi:hypothetical protein
MNLIYTPNRNSGSGMEDPRVFSSIFPFYWDWPTGSYPSSPFSGSKLEVHLDPAYTNLIDDFTVTTTAPYYAENLSAFLMDFIGDNIYFWRVQPRYKLPNYQAIYGSWTSGWSFRRLGYTAKNLQTSVSWATPTFNWDMVEGASTYRLQVSTYPNFSSTIINQVTPLTSYTPPTTLAQGVYYWRVQVIRYDGIVNGWSEVEQFTLSLPTPTGLIPDGNPPPMVHYAPTFCWDPIKSPISEPLLTAWKYRVQISRVENFSTIYETIDTSNICWTPTKGYDDGTYYWHVAMIDGNGNLGNYSFTATFIKQYPVTELISPIGGPIPATPTFIWTPVDGAATYLFEISKYSTFSPIYDKVETINTQFTPTKTYDSNTLYFWRVAIKDRNGKQGPFTDATISIGVEKHLYLPLIMR